MEEELTLKPCPFCGGEAELNRSGNQHTKSQKAKVFCKTFGCFGQQIVGVINRHGRDYAWAKEKVIENWNRRAND